MGITPGESKNSLVWLGEQLIRLDHCNDEIIQQSLVHGIVLARQMVQALQIVLDDPVFY
jgi:hypothetical protein